jgi:hypothetical protein
MANKITHAEVRMYRMGTGDCFAIKFFAGEGEAKVKFKMMIDCGVWTGSKVRLQPFIEDLKSYLNNEVDLLVVTHEHIDHVLGFERCSDLFTTGFNVKNIWMGWTEDDSLPKVSDWKTEHGEKKIALAEAAARLKKSIEGTLENHLSIEHRGNSIFNARKRFSDSLSGFADLHIQSVNGVYKGLLQGMRVVKEEIADNNIDYKYPGEIIEDIDGLDGIKIYILGPPEKWNVIEKESGGEDESYTHNTTLKEMDAFAASALSSLSGGNTTSSPFDDHYSDLAESQAITYAAEDWRTINDDWLYTAGGLALRINSLTNNLSLALAIEFTGNKRVMLFPGDAEYGSWSSWHEINWNEESVDPAKHLTEEILNKTVFYKVAHHMSHNGTAQRLGLNMMKHKDLVAMATLDYGVIGESWPNTMPNHELVDELLTKTKGRLIIMKEDNIFYDFDGKVPIAKKIRESRNQMTATQKTAFNKAFKEDPGGKWYQFRVKA